jgi:hypothetical protein
VEKSGKNCTMEDKKMLISAIKNALRKMQLRKAQRAEKRERQELFTKLLAGSSVIHMYH